MGVSERKERERVARRQAILDAAAKAFIEKGFHKTSIDEIASNVELSVGTIYLYFKNKDELFVSLLFDGLKKFTERFEEIQGSNTSAREKIKQAWLFFLDLYEHNPMSYHILNHLGTADVKKSLSDDTLNKIIAATGRNFVLLSQMVDECMKQGIYTKAPPMEIVDAMWSLFLGMIQLYETRQNLGLKSPSLKQLHIQNFRRLEKGLLMSKQRKIYCL